MNTTDFVVLWSPHQKCFHVETVGQMLRENRDIYARQELGDYIVLGFERTREAADASIEKIRHVRDEAQNA